MLRARREWLLKCAAPSKPYEDRRRSRADMLSFSISYILPSIATAASFEASSDIGGRQPDDTIVEAAKRRVVLAIAKLVKRLSHDASSAWALMPS